MTAGSVVARFDLVELGFGPLKQKLDTLRLSLSSSLPLSLLGRLWGGSPVCAVSSISSSPPRHQATCLFGRRGGRRGQTGKRPVREVVDGSEFVARSSQPVGDAELFSRPLELCAEGRPQQSRDAKHALHLSLSLSLGVLMQKTTTKKVMMR